MEGITKQLVFFNLKDIDPEADIWPWGGEPIYRNDEFVGTVTSTGYILIVFWKRKFTHTNTFRFGFSTNKLICLGFIRKPASSPIKTITPDFILSKDVIYQVDIAGRKFQAVPHLHPPLISSIPEYKKYRPTISNKSIITG